MERTGQTEGNKRPCLDARQIRKLHSKPKHGMGANGTPSGMTTALFVPSSEGGLLTRLVGEVENELRPQTGWAMKIIENSGIPLSQLLKPMLKMERGCALGQSCKLCHNTGIGCNTRNVVCKECPQQINTTKEFSDSQNQKMVNVDPDCMEVFAGKYESIM